LRVWKVKTAFETKRNDRISAQDLLSFWAALSGKALKADFREKPEIWGFAYARSRSQSAQF